MNIIGQLTFVAINNGSGSKTRGVGAGQGRWQLMATFRNRAWPTNIFKTLLPGDKPNLSFN